MSEDSGNPRSIDRRVLSLRFVNFVVNCLPLNRQFKSGSKNFDDRGRMGVVV